MNTRASYRPKNPTAPKLRPHRLRGFTLVELLVVITIVVVLAAFSIMGFKQLREKADVVTTLKRIRGFSDANAMYATDHNGKYVPVFTFDEDGQGAVMWHYNREFLEALIGDNDKFLDAEPFEGIDGLPEQVLDPAVVRAKKKYWSRISASFGYNGENLTGGAWGEPNAASSRSIASMSYPDETCAFVTATDWRAKQSGGLLWEKSPVEGKTGDGKVAYRHQGKAVVAYYDGHTGLISIDDMKEINRRGGVNNVFWGGNRRSSSR
jgi:prepilin-type N-terminal cleavage/methylation domain-containing protein/prepilin-type processing-associated H-X9-DG protein